MSIPPPGRTRATGPKRGRDEKTPAVDPMSAAGAGLPAMAANTYGQGATAMGDEDSPPPAAAAGAGPVGLYDIQHRRAHAIEQRLAKEDEAKAAAAAEYTARIALQAQLAAAAAAAYDPKLADADTQEYFKRKQHKGAWKPTTVEDKTVYNELVPHISIDPAWLAARLASAGLRYTHYEPQTEMMGIKRYNNGGVWTDLRVDENTGTYPLFIVTGDKLIRFTSAQNIRAAFVVIGPLSSFIDGREDNKQIVIVKPDESHQRDDLEFWNDHRTEAMNADHGVEQFIASSNDQSLYLAVVTFTAEDQFVIRFLRFSVIDRVFTVLHSVVIPSGGGITAPHLVASDDGLAFGLVRTRFGPSSNTTQSTCEIYERIPDSKDEWKSTVILLDDLDRDHITYSLIASSNKDYVFIDVQYYGSNFTVHVFTHASEYKEHRVFPIDLSDYEGFDTNRAFTEYDGELFFARDEWLLAVDLETGELRDVLNVENGYGIYRVMVVEPQTISVLVVPFRDADEYGDDDRQMRGQVFLQRWHSTTSVTAAPAAYNGDDD